MLTGTISCVFINLANKTASESESDHGNTIIIYVVEGIEIGRVSLLVRKRKRQGVHRISDTSRCISWGGKDTELVFDL